MKSFLYLITSWNVEVKLHAFYTWAFASFSVSFNPRSYSVGCRIRHISVNTATKIKSQSLLGIEIWSVQPILTD
jgi:hypothetical protein